MKYRTCEKEIRRIEEEIERWESRAQKCTASYHLAPGGGGDDKIQSAVDALAELRAELYDQLLCEKEARDRIQAAIRTVEDERLRLLLEYRYIDGMRTEEIAVKLHLEYRWVRRLINRAINQLTLESPLESVI